MTATLEVERDRVLLLTGSDALAIAPDELPDKPGLYSLWATSERAIHELGLKEVTGEGSLLERPLYVGKAEDSLLKRVRKKHLSSGDTGHSTLRRTFAALLDLESRPRRSGIATPTPTQLRTITTNFDLSPTDDDRLTEWIAVNITVRAAASDWVPLKELERAVGAVLRPPLDQERPPMWEPNPWRSQVEGARRKLQSRARLAAGMDA